MTQASFADAAAWLRDSVVEVRQGASTGSGLTWSFDVVVTNAHVTARGPVDVRIPNGEMRLGEVRFADRLRDIAVIDVPGLCLPAARRVDPATVRPGHMLFAIGHPFGVRHALSAGILHAVGPLPDDCPLPPDQRRLPWIQADIRLAPGSSGGPLADAEGHVVGVSTMIVSGLALAVPVTAVEALVRARAA